MSFPIHRGGPLLSEPPALDEGSLPAWLEETGLVRGAGALRVEAAGDGNINWVRRVRAADGSSWIVKQARPALERFPEYRVTPDRLLCEARFYETVRPWDRDGVCPRVLHFDAPARVLVLEDLGDAPRLDRTLAASGDATGAARELGRFLGRVHRESRGLALASRFPNHEMRRLHGDHIFVLPFGPNEFPLAPALRARAEQVWCDAELGAIASAAYRDYLRPDGVLVHGDVQAGNVLLAPGGTKLLDAEIAHVGDPAFDLGTLAAHLLLPALAAAAPDRALPALAAAWEAYRAEDPDAPDFRAAARYAAIETLRRTIGAARVAAVEKEEAARVALDAALRWMRDPPCRPAGFASV